jgi:uncharacterized protein with GYD domain
MMPTYILLSNLTDDGARTLKEKPNRLQEVNKEIEKLGAPDNEAIARVSVELSARGSVRLLTLPAIPVANFVRNLK